MIPFLKRSFANERIEADTYVMVPEDDVTALSILTSTNYLVCMERLLNTEASAEKLQSIKSDIPYQKEHILELWDKVKDPSRVRALAKERDEDAYAVRARLLEELESEKSEP